MKANKTTGVIKLNRVILRNSLYLILVVVAIVLTIVTGTKGMM